MCCRDVKTWTRSAFKIAMAAGCLEDHRACTGFLGCQYFYGFSSGCSAALMQMVFSCSVASSGSTLIAGAGTIELAEYRNSEMCHWEVQCPAPSSRLIFVFAGDTEWCCDLLTIDDGSMAPVWRGFFVSVLSLNSPRATVSFTTDGTGVGSGWGLTWGCVDWSLTPAIASRAPSRLALAPGPFLAGQPAPLLNVTAFDAWGMPAPCTEPTRDRAFLVLWGLAAPPVTWRCDPGGAFVASWTPALPGAAPLRVFALGAQMEGSGALVITLPPDGVSPTRSRFEVTGGAMAGYAFAFTLTALDTAGHPVGCPALNLSEAFAVRLGGAPPSWVQCDVKRAYLVGWNSLVAPTRVGQCSLVVALSDGRHLAGSPQPSSCPRPFEVLVEPRDAFGNPSPCGSFLDPFQYAFNLTLQPASPGAGGLEAAWPYGIQWGCHPDGVRFSALVTPTRPGRFNLTVALLYADMPQLVGAPITLTIAPVADCLLLACVGADCLLLAEAGRPFEVLLAPAARPAECLPAQAAREYSLLWDGAPPAGLSWACAGGGLLLAARWVPPLAALPLGPNGTRLPTGPHRLEVCAGEGAAAVPLAGSPAAVMLVPPAGNADGSQRLCQADAECRGGGGDPGATCRPTNLTGSGAAGQLWACHCSNGMLAGGGEAAGALCATAMAAAAAAGANQGALWAAFLVGPLSALAVGALGAAFLCATRRRARRRVAPMSAEERPPRDVARGAAEGAEMPPIQAANPLHRAGGHEDPAGDGPPQDGSPRAGAPSPLCLNPGGGRLHPLAVLPAAAAHPATAGTPSAVLPVAPRANPPGLAAVTFSRSRESPAPEAKQTDPTCHAGPDPGAKLKLTLPEYDIMLAASRFTEEADALRGGLQALPEYDITCGSTFNDSTAYGRITSFSSECQVSLVKSSEQVLGVAVILIIPNQFVPFTLSIYTGPTVSTTMRNSVITMSGMIERWVTYPVMIFRLTTTSPPQSLVGPVELAWVFPPPSPTWGRIVSGTVTIDRYLPAGEPALVYVTLRDSSGVPVACAAGLLGAFLVTYGNAILTEVSWACAEDGVRFVGRWVPTEAGGDVPLQVHVRADPVGSAVVRVVPGTPSPSQTVFVVPPHPMAGEPCVVEVHAYDRYGNTVPCLGPERLWARLNGTAPTHWGCSDWITLVSWGFETLTGVGPILLRIELPEAGRIPLAGSPRVVVVEPGYMDPAMCRLSAATSASAPGLPGRLFVGAQLAVADCYGNPLPCDAKFMNGANPAADLVDASPSAVMWSCQGGLFTATVLTERVGTYRLAVAVGSFNGTVPVVVVAGNLSVLWAPPVAVVGRPYTAFVSALSPRGALLPCAAQPADWGPASFALRWDGQAGPPAGLGWGCDVDGIRWAVNWTVPAAMAEPSGQQQRLVATAAADGQPLRGSPVLVAIAASAGACWADEDCSHGGRCAGDPPDTRCLCPGGWAGPTCADPLEVRLCADDAQCRLGGDLGAACLASADPVAVVPVRACLCSNGSALVGSPSGLTCVPLPSQASPATAAGQGAVWGAYVTGPLSALATWGLLVLWRVRRERRAAARVVPAAPLAVWPGGSSRPAEEPATNPLFLLQAPSSSGPVAPCAAPLPAAGLARVVPPLTPPPPYADDPPPPPPLRGVAVPDR
ncbi:hypothetical protein PAPYR_6786 [Paratrimastix pyriformis]|uniref:EGF-like domain-containing protein n=1 Tax=Paratrimastix pyriformis TaxID=342808 RepID=A0ABQ8UIA9_9EUKA|nr:hypothetical protein PAPYR_6786 [Paratrimastix pyriformis]